MRRWTILVVLMVVVLVGCGGPSTTNGTASKPLPGTAKFHIDIASGQVSVTAGSGAGSRAILLGGTASFATSTLLDQPGNTGLKIVNVAVRNDRVADIGRQPDGVVTGVRVLFSPFVTAQAFSDLRAKVTVGALMAPGVDDTVDGPLASAACRGPYGAAVGADGSVYITDIVAHRVRKIRAGFVSTLAGSGTAGSADGLGASAQFAAPAGIAVNPRDGSLVVVEYTGNRVRRVTADGRVTTIAGTGAAGGADGAGNVATLTTPLGVAAAADGTLFVMERTRLRRIQQVGADPALASSYTVSTLAGSATAGSRDGVGAAAQFGAATGVALGPNGRLFVADTGNHRIRLVMPDGAAATIAGSGAQTSVDGDGATASFRQPIGVVWAGDALVVTEDAGQVIRQVSLRAGGTAAPGNPRSWSVQTLAGTPGATTVTLTGDGTVATFSGLRLPAVDGHGTLIVPEVGTRAIRTVSPPNGLFPVGTPGGSGDAGAVRLASADGLIPSSIFGANLPFVSYPGVVAPGASTAAKPWVFAVPQGVTAFEFMVTVESDTSVYAAPEAVGNTSAGIRVVGSPNVRVRTLTGGDAGMVDGDLGSARFGPTLGLARDAQGRLYVSDANDRIRCIEPGGPVYTIAGITRTGSLLSVNPINGPGNVADFATPRGLAVNADGTVVYVAESGRSRVRIIELTGADRTNPADWTVSSLAGGATFSGAQAGLVNGSNASFRFTTGWGVATPDDLYVTEASGNRVRRLHFTGGRRADSLAWEVTVVAGDASALSGAAGDIDGVGQAARLNGPQGLAVDRAGTLYVAEAGASRVRRIENPGGTPGSARVSLWAGAASSVLGSARTGLLDGVGSVARFSAPVGLAIDAAGYVYVTDYQNRRIRRIGPNADVTTLAGSGATNAVFGGISDGTSNTIIVGENADGTGANSGFAAVRALVVDPAGNVYVADANRIRLIERALTPSGP